MFASSSCDARWSGKKKQDKKKITEYEISIKRWAAAAAKKEKKKKNSVVLLGGEREKKTGRM